MNDPDASAPPAGHARPIAEQAAEWFGRCELGLTPEQELAFRQWLEADPRHGEALRDMDDTWDALDRLKASPVFATFAPRGAWRRRWGFPALMAAAAVAFLLLWPGMAPRPENYQRTVATEADGLRRLELPDGSVVHLNASSRITLHFAAGERRVLLQAGEAHFAVARDAARPFVVTAGDVAVRAVGTAFNVRRESGGVEVLVTEGRVALADATRGGSLLPVAPAAAPDRPAPAATPGGEVLLAGQRALVPAAVAATPRAATIAAVAPDEMQTALAWRERQLDFDLTPLAEVAAAFNRCNDHQLVIADDALGRELFGGTFRADKYDVFVQLLEQRFGVTAERSADRTILRRAR